jgi:hypothetical protein
MIDLDPRVLSLYEQQIPGLLGCMSGAQETVSSSGHDRKSQIACNPPPPPPEREKARQRLVIKECDLYYQYLALCV